jgi:hypothetical protein
MNEDYLWLKVGDENIKFFHHHANGRKEKNTIWSIHKSDGSEATSFEDISTVGISHFQNLFKVENRATIDSILQVANLFPSFVDQEGNEYLMAEISKEELCKVMQSFYKDRSLGSDGLATDFYSGYFDFSRDDLLRTVEYSQPTGQVLDPFNATFITLIPR